MFFPFGPTAPRGGAGSDTFQVLGEVHYLLPSGYWQMGLSLVAHLNADNEKHLVTLKSNIRLILECLDISRVGTPLSSSASIFIPVMAARFWTA